MTLASPIVHHPFKFGIAGYELTGFGIAVLMSFLIAQIVSERELARRGHDVEAAAVGDVLFAALLGTMIALVVVGKLVLWTLVVWLFGQPIRTALMVSTASWVRMIWAPAVTAQQAQAKAAGNRASISNPNNEPMKDFRETPKSKGRLNLVKRFHAPSNSKLWFNVFPKPIPTSRTT
jgi:hypothetical protein